MQDKQFSIKQMAKEAKSRMKSGFWTEVKQQRDEEVACALAGGKNADCVIKDYSQMLKSRIYHDVSDEDEIFYRRVCELLESNEVVINPIGRLADNEALASMTEDARQLYVWELSEKYRKMKARYEHEKTFFKQGK